MTAKEIITKELPEPYKTLALANMKNLPLNITRDPKDLYEAINHAFIWAHTPEGRDFWKGVRRALREGKTLPDATPFLKKTGFSSKIFLDGEEFDELAERTKLEKLLKDRDALSVMVRAQRALLKKYERFIED